MKKVYKKKKRYWIFTIRIAMYKTFIPSFKHLLIYIKERAILEKYQEPSCLEYYLEKIKEWYKNRNKNEVAIMQNWLKKIKFYKNIKKV